MIPAHPLTNPPRERAAETERTSEGLAGVNRYIQRCTTEEASEISLFLTEGGLSPRRAIILICHDAGFLVPTKKAAV